MPNQRVCEGCFRNLTPHRRVCEGCFQDLTPIQRVCKGCFQNLTPNQRVCKGCFQNLTTHQRVCKGFSYVLQMILKRNSFRVEGDCAWTNGCGENQACRACTFDSPGLATIGAYPGERRREKIYAIGIVLSLNSFVQKEYHSRTNPFIACEWARHRKRKYNPQGGSIFACVVTWGSLLSSATPGYRK